MSENALDTKHYMINKQLMLMSWEGGLLFCYLSWEFAPYSCPDIPTVSYSEVVSVTVDE